MRKEFEWLDRQGALSSNTVLVHGIAFRETEWKRMACAGASLVWCPASNMHLYGVTADIPAALKVGVKVCIGTDGAVTGGMGLLDEMRLARRLYPEIPSRILFDMVTKTAASIFGIDDKLGTLDSGKLADLLIIPRKSDDPFKDLIDLQSEDIALLMVGGVPVYGDAAFLKELRLYSEHVNRFLVAGKEKFVIGDLEGLLASINLKLGYEKVFDFLPPVEFLPYGAADVPLPGFRNLP
jgi:cytosine/adenosine deaminase-related metal-dependent hydrolase